MVVDANLSKPVCRPKFPANREFTGNFFEFWPISAVHARKSLLLSSGCGLIPCEAEQGNIFTEQGIVFAEQGMNRGE
jgi:hypothetical protein